MGHLLISWGHFSYVPDIYWANFPQFPRKWIFMNLFFFFETFHIWCPMWLFVLNWNTYCQLSSAYEKNVPNIFVSEPTYAPLIYLGSLSIILLISRKRLIFSSVFLSDSKMFLPIAPWTVPYNILPECWVDESPRFSMTKDPWRKTFIISPTWICPTSVICCLSSSVEAALKIKLVLELFKNSYLKSWNQKIRKFGCPTGW